MDCGRVSPDYRTPNPSTDPTTNTVVKATITLISLNKLGITNTAAKASNLQEMTIMMGCELDAIC